MKYFLFLTLVIVFLSFTFVSAPAQDQLGEVTSSSVVACNGGLSGGTCYALAVSCPEVAPVAVSLKVFSASKRPAGFVLLGTGGLGNTWFETDTYGYVTIQNLLSARFSVAEIAFNAGWQVETNGAGLRKAACRYSTVANWVKAQFSASEPFCVSGNSSGAAVIGYGLSHYGLDQTLTFALLTSGPPFSRVDWACNASEPPAQEYCTNVMKGWDVGISNAENYIDPAYLPTYSAACSTMLKEQSKALDFLFLPDSINSPDANLNYKIGVEFMYGAQDTASTTINQGEYYRRSIVSPTSRACIQDAPHTIANALSGAQAIATDIMNQCH